MERGFIISLVLATIVGVFALSNGEPVEIDFIFTEIVMSQALVIFLSAILGAIIVAFMAWVKELKFKKEIKLLKKKIEEITEENTMLADLVETKEEQIKTLYNSEIEKEIDTEISTKE